MLNGAYLPYYKWQFRALRELPYLADLADVLEWLICSDNSAETAAQKESVVEAVALAIIAALQERALTPLGDSELEKHAYAVNNTIEDGNVRNLHILYGV